VYTLAEIVRFVARLQGLGRLVVPLPGWAAQAQAFVLERLPGPVMTRDNLASMKVDSVCSCPFPAVFGFAPSAMEVIVPEYMAAAGLRGRYAKYRRGSGR
jgi:NADH dehydrogenase